MNIDEKLSELRAKLEGIDDQIEVVKAEAEEDIADIRNARDEKIKVIKAERAEINKSIKKIEGIKEQLESIY